MARECSKPLQSQHNVYTKREKIDISLRKWELRKRNKRITMIIAHIACSNEIPREIIHEN